MLAQVTWPDAVCRRAGLIICRVVGSSPTRPTDAERAIQDVRWQCGAFLVAVVVAIAPTRWQFWRRRWARSCATSGSGRARVSLPCPRLGLTPLRLAKYQPRPCAWGIRVRGRCIRSGTAVSLRGNGARAWRSRRRSPPVLMLVGSRAHLLASDASSRAALAVVSGPSGGPNAEAEQALLDTIGSPDAGRRDGRAVPARGNR